MNINLQPPVGILPVMYNVPKLLCTEIPLYRNCRVPKLLCAECPEVRVYRGDLLPVVPAQSCQKLWMEDWRRGNTQETSPWPVMWLLTTNQMPHLTRECLDEAMRSKTGRGRIPRAIPPPTWTRPFPLPVKNYRKLLKFSHSRQSLPKTSAPRAQHVTW